VVFPYLTPYARSSYRVLPYEVTPYDVAAGNILFGNPYGDAIADPAALSGLIDAVDPFVVSTYRETLSGQARVHSIPVEVRLKDSRYEIRAEIPGVDPYKDIQITIRDSHLAIEVQRTQDAETIGHSEFLYGKAARTIQLPLGVDLGDIKAKHEHGILTVSIATAAASSSPQHVEIHVE
jgi:HSP20 family protein